MLFSSVKKSRFSLHSAAGAHYQEDGKHSKNIIQGIYRLQEDVSSLSNLLDKIKIKGDTAFGKPGKVVNFILNENNELVFGDGSINIHGQLTGKKIEGEKRGPFFLPKNSENYQCYAAGKLVFNEQNQIIGISNLSEDFRPSFDSLQFALQALFEAEKKGAVQIAENIVVREYGQEEMQLFNDRHLDQISKQDLHNDVIPSPCVISVAKIHTKETLKDLLKPDSTEFQLAQERYNNFVKKIDINNDDDDISPENLLIGAVIASAGIVAEVNVQRSQFESKFIEAGHDYTGQPSYQEEVFREKGKKTEEETHFLVDPKPHQAQKFYDKIIEKLLYETIEAKINNKNLQEDPESLSYLLEKDNRFTTVKEKVASIILEQNKKLRQEPEEKKAAWQQSLIKVNEDLMAAIKTTVGGSNLLQQNNIQFLDDMDPTKQFNNLSTIVDTLNKSCESLKLKQGNDSECVTAWKMKTQIDKLNIIKNEGEILNNKIRAADDIMTQYDSVQVENHGSPTALTTAKLNAVLKINEHESTFAQERKAQRNEKWKSAAIALGPLTAGLSLVVAAIVSKITHGTFNFLAPKPDSTKLKEPYGADVLEAVSKIPAPGAR